MCKLCRLCSEIQSLGPETAQTHGLHVAALGVQYRLWGKKRNLDIVLLNPAVIKHVLLIRELLAMCGL